MASLKEIKNRINSIQSTQKITAAMKMVASAKLHHTQAATERTLAYAEQLTDILQSLLAAEQEFDSPYTVRREVKNVAIVVCSSNTGLCGSFNANVWKSLEELIQSYKAQQVHTEFYPVGTKNCKRQDMIIMMSLFPSLITWNMERLPSWQHSYGSYISASKLIR